MASSGWQGNKDFPYVNQYMKCNLYITHITHTGTTLRVQGNVGAVCPYNQNYSAYYVYPVYETAGGQGADVEKELLAANEKVWGDTAGTGLSTAKTKSFDVTINGVSASATSYNFPVYIRMNNDQNVGTLRWTLTFDASASGPSGGYINGLAATYNTSTGLVDFTATSVGVTDVGTGTLISPQFMILEQPYVSGVARQMVPYTNGGSVLLNQDNSTAQSGGITIQFNHLYHSGLYAANSNYPTTPDYRYQGPTVVSPAASPTVTFSSATPKTATFSYTMPADAGYYSRKLQYSLNGTTWTDVTTATGTSAKTGTFTVSGLSSAHDYTLRVRTNTTAGNTPGANVAFTAANGLYVSVSSKTKSGKKAYCSVSGQTKKVKKIYASVSGKTRLIYKDT